MRPPKVRFSLIVNRPRTPFYLINVDIFDRVIRAFLIEEQKIVKKVLADMSRKSKKSE